MGRKVGVVVQLVPLSVGELSHHLIRGEVAWAEAYLQAPYQVASLSIQPFSHNTPTSETDQTDRTDNSPVVS